MQMGKYFVEVEVEVDLVRDTGNDLDGTTGIGAGLPIRVK